MSIFNNKRPIQQAIHRHNAEPVNKLLLHPDSGLATVAGSSTRPMGIWSDVQDIWGALLSVAETVADIETLGVLHNFFTDLFSNDLLVDVRVRTPAGVHTYTNLKLQSDSSSDHGETTNYYKDQLKAGKTLRVKLIYDGGKISYAVPTSVVVDHPEIKQVQNQALSVGSTASAISNTFGGTQGSVIGWNVASIIGGNNPGTVNTVFGQFTNTKGPINLTPSFKQAWSMHDNTYINALNTAGQRFQINPQYLLVIMMIESHCVNGQISSTGAAGLMQVEPGTFKEQFPLVSPHYFVLANNISDPITNIMVGSYYFTAVCFQPNGGNPIKAAAAYNAGPNGDFNNAETQAYVKKFAQYYKMVQANTNRNTSSAFSGRPEITGSDQTGGSLNNSRLAVGGIAS